jgi:Dolichyl-phosphate-mannose-protein mannosyltransferase
MCKDRAAAKSAILKFERMSAPLAKDIAPSSEVGGVRGRPAWTAAAVLIYWLLVAAFQYGSGAANAAFGGYPDEPSHYLSGLMVRDYLVSHFPAPPLAYAANYYTHLPFMAVGYWPPMFYVLEGLWMAALGYQRSTVLWLPGLSAALLAGTCFWLLERRLGRAGAFLFGLLFLMIPAVQWSNRLVMVDTTFTLFCWWAGIAFGIWAGNGSRWAALAAGLLAAAGLLTKINSVYLFLLPPLFFLVTGRWRLLRQRSFWLIPAVVAVLWGPWILKTQGLTMIGYGGYAFTSVLSVAIELIRALLDNLLWLALLAGIGMVSIWKRRRQDSVLLVCALLPLCYAAFLLAVRAGVEARFLLPVIAPAMVVAGIGLEEVARKLASRRLPATRLATLVAAVSVAAFGAVAGIERHELAANPVRPVAEFLAGRGSPEESSVLVPSNAEGPFIAEFAMHDARRPVRLLVRPLKLLAQVDWSASSYRELYQTPAELVALFDRFPVRYLVVPAKLDSHCFPHDQLLKETLESHAERWRRLHAPGDSWLVYERIDGRRLPPAEMEAYAREVLQSRLSSVTRALGLP